MACPSLARVGRVAAAVGRPLAVGTVIALMAGGWVFGTLAAAAQQAGEQRSNASLAAPPSPSDDPPRAVSGWVIGADGRGVERATITIQRPASAPAAPSEDIEWVSAGTAASGFDGHFGLSLPPGEWELRVTTPEGHVGRARVSVGPDGAEPDLVVDVAPSDGSEPMVQAHDARPCPSTLYAVRGTVRAASGAPLAGQRVTAEWPGGAHSCSDEAASTTTASDGSYQLTLGPGLWRLHTWVWGPALGSEVARTANVSGALAGVDLAVPAEPATLVELSGTLQAPDGAAAGGGYHVDASGEDSRWQTRNVSTSADGSFTLRVPPGRWWVNASYAAGGDGSLASSYRLPRFQVAVGNAGVSGVAARMQAAASFRLRLRTPSGAAVSQRAVSVDQVLSSGAGSQYLACCWHGGLTARLDGTTPYRSGYLAGLYRVMVSGSPGSNGAPGRLGVETFVEVPVGANTIDVTVPEEADSPILSGTVHAPGTGAGVSGARVASSMYHPGYGYLRASATTASDGAFRLPAVPGVWRLEASPSNCRFLDMGHHVDVPASGLGSVSLTLCNPPMMVPTMFEPDGELASARLRGYVRDAAGHPVEGAEVSVWDPAAHRRVATWSAANGWYELAVRPGTSGTTWTVHVSTWPMPLRHLGAAFVRLAPGLDGGATFDFALPLKSSYSRAISGTVRWPDGTPAHNRRIEARLGGRDSVGVQQPQDVFTSSAYDGAFSLAVPAGVWCVQAHGERGREFGGARQCNLDTSGGSISSLILTLAAPTATLAGTITDRASGLAVPGASVVYASSSSQVQASTYSRADGRYRLYAFSTSNSGAVSVWHSGLLERTDTGVALPAGTSTRDVPLRRATRTLAGRVVSGATPRSEVPVGAEISEDGVTWRLREHSDGQGVFSLGVWPGTWLVRAVGRCLLPARSVVVSENVADIVFDVSGCATPTSTPVATPAATPTPTATSARPQAVVGIRPPGVAVAPSATVTVALQVALTEGVNLGVWNVEVSYDPSVVQAIACSPSGGSVCNPAFAPNTVRVTGAALPPLVGAQSLASLTFRAVGAIGTSSPLVVTIIELADGAAAPLATATTNGAIRIGRSPRVASLSSSSGPGRGGTLLTISGDNFQSGASVTLGGRAGTQVTYVNTSGLTARTPAHSRTVGDVNGSGSVTAVDALCVLRAVAALPGTTACPASALSSVVDVVVTNPDGQSDTLAGGYTYQHADANGSGSVTAVDALCVLRQVAALPATSACPAS